MTANTTDDRGRESRAGAAAAVARSKEQSPRASTPSPAFHRPIRRRSRPAPGASRSSLPASATSPALLRPQPAAAQAGRNGPRVLRARREGDARGRRRGTRPVLPRRVVHVRLVAGRPSPMPKTSVSRTCSSPPMARCPRPSASRRACRPGSTRSSSPITTPTPTSSRTSPRSNASFSTSSSEHQKAHAVRAKGGYTCGLYASYIEYDGDQRRRMLAAVEHIRPYVDEVYALPLYNQAAFVSEQEKARGWKPIQGQPRARGRAARSATVLGGVHRGPHLLGTASSSACCFGPRRSLPHGRPHAGRLYGGLERRAFPGVARRAPQEGRDRDGVREVRDLQLGKFLIKYDCLPQRRKDFSC